MEINKTFNEKKISEEFTTGSEFSSICEFYDAFALSALKMKILVRIAQRSLKSITLKCKEIGCSFKVSARFITRESKCVVKCMNPFHGCILGMSIQNQNWLEKKQ